VRGIADRVLFRRERAWTLALLRVLFGLTLVAWTVTMMFDASTFLADDGVVAPAFAANDGWRWLDLDSTASVWVALVALILVASTVTIGLRPSVSLVVAFVLLVSLQRRDPLILNSGDLILRDMALLLALCPTGAAFSVDRWVRHGRTALWTAPTIAPWGLRLIQLQVMVVYLFAFWSKSGDLWHDGTAVSTALRLDDLRRFTPPGVMIDDVVIVAALTWGVLVVELALGTLRWYRPLRPLLIPLGIALLLFIDGFMLVGFFGPVMTIGLLSFVEPDWIERWVRRRDPAPAPTDEAVARRAVLFRANDGSVSA
jgi:hypothetical protein